MLLKWFLISFFTKLNFAAKVICQSIPFVFNLMGAKLKFRNFKRETLLLSIIFSLTIAGVFTSFDVYLKGFEMLISQVLVKYLIIACLVFSGLILLGYPIVVLLRKINKVVPWSSRWVSRIALDLILIFLISTTTAVLFALVFSHTFDNNIILYSKVAKYFTFSLIACMTFVLLIESVVFFNDRKDYLQKNELLLRENLEVRFEVLKNQVNSHFLFNNLNVLSSLVYEDPVRADKFIVQFSNIYRYVLEMQNETLVPLRKELAFFESYTYLLKQRFTDGIVVKNELTMRSMKMMLPPLTLQLLMENVVKHNVISPNKPLEVVLQERGDIFVFKNKVIPRKEEISHSGLGLANIKERFQLMSSKLPAFSNKNGYFVALIPLLNPLKDD